MSCLLHKLPEDCTPREAVFLAGTGELIICLLHAGNSNGVREFIHRVQDPGYI